MTLRLDGLKNFGFDGALKKGIISTRLFGIQWVNITADNMGHHAKRDQRAILLAT